MLEEGGGLSNSQEVRLLASYREMATDQEHEAEALEWCEGLIRDATRQECDGWWASFASPVSGEPSRPKR